jgi:sulfate adenylyltransferase subunit 1
MKFMTCGSVDDGKSTLIGRLLMDSEGALTDDQRQKAGVASAQDLASLTDGLEAEKAQGITIDIAYRYFNTPARKFVIADCPGHEQYTRNMVTAASTMDAALILVDVTKLDIDKDTIELLVQTKRHALLTHLLRVPNLVFVVNKLDAVSQPQVVFKRVSEAINQLAKSLNLQVAHIVPVSALVGTNVVKPGYLDWGIGVSLLDVLQTLASGSARDDSSVEDAVALLSVQWVELTKTDTQVQGASRRVLWTQLMRGHLKVGDSLLDGSGLSSTVVALYSTTRQPLDAISIRSGATQDPVTVGIVLAQERDVSRGDWLGSERPSVLDDDIHATIAWLDVDSGQIDRPYWLRHAHRWVKAKIVAIKQVQDMHTLQMNCANQLAVNDIAQVVLRLESPVPYSTYSDNRQLGSMVLVDTAHHRTVAAVMV